MCLQRLFRKRLFQRLPNKYQSIDKVIVSEVNIINKSIHDNINEDFILGYHSIHSHNYNEVIESILHNGFNTFSYSGNKGSGSYFSTHSTYPLVWGRNKFIFCKIRLDPRYVNVFRSELPPGFELKITKKDNIIPICSIDAHIMRTVGDSMIEREGDYWKPHNTGCIKCDEKGVRCDCRLSLDVLDDIIRDDKEFIKYMTQHSV